MLLKKRGAALLQVLIVTAILAGMSAMILRLSLARTITSRQTRHVINAQMVIESCMAEVNAIWAAKKPEIYARDLAACQMCDPDSNDSLVECSEDNKSIHRCAVELFEGVNFRVEAKMSSVAGWTAESGTPPCTIEYIITNKDNNARQTL